jgi:hypothetical protein
LEERAVTGVEVGQKKRIGKVLERGPVLTTAWICDSRVAGNLLNLR